MGSRDGLGHLSPSIWTSFVGCGCCEGMVGCRRELPPPAPVPLSHCSMPDPCLLCLPGFRPFGHRRLKITAADNKSARGLAFDHP